MATSNFTKVNASNYFVIEDLPDFELYNLADDLTERVKAQGLKCKYLDEWHNDYVHILSMNEKISAPCYFSADMDMILTFQSGYYSGGNLDFDFCCMGYCGDFWLSDYDCAEDMAEDILNDYIEYNSNYQDINPGILKIHAERMKKSILSQIEAMMDKMNDLCRSLCDIELRCLGHFSNGSAIYQAV